MAYSIKPTYEPMTFQEMLQPYAVYGAEEERQNDAYMKLLEDARSLEDLKDSAVDSEEYNKYVDFKNRINSMVDEISATGLSRQTRDNLNKYRAEYQSDFANMVDRIKRRGELVRQQRAYLAEHPNAFFDVDYSNTPAIKVVEGSSYTPYCICFSLLDIQYIVFYIYSTLQLLRSLCSYRSQFAQGLNEVR